MDITPTEIHIIPQLESHRRRVGTLEEHGKRIESKLGEHDHRFEKIESVLEEHSSSLDIVKRTLIEHSTKLNVLEDAVERGFQRMDQGFAELRQLILTHF